jgi:hypothetical protein
MGKYLTEVIVEGKASVLDNLSEPYLILLDNELGRLNQAVNIVAVQKGYRVLSVSESIGRWTVCLEKK